MHDWRPALTAATRRPRVFWGWWIFAAAIVGQFVTIGFAAQVIGVFLVPMTEDLGWSRSEFVLASSLGFGIGAITGMLIGPLIDRYGARPIMLVGTTISGVALVGVSQVEELWQFIFVRGALTQIGLFMIGPFVVNTTLSKWFVINRGRVIALASLGTSIGGIIPPLVLTPIVDNAGWETGWVVMGITTLVLMYPASLVMRRQPEDYGMLPDGKTGDEEPTAHELEELELLRQDFDNSYTRGEAVRTRSMWLLVFGFAFAVAAVAIMYSHVIPFMTDVGYTRSQAAFAFAVQGSFALVSKFFWAWVVQKYSPRILTVLTMAMMGVSTAFLVPAADTSYSALLVVFAVFGFGIGGMFPLFDFVWAWYFGRRHIGAVRSMGFPVSVVIAVTGPILTGIYYDSVGDYRGAFFTLAFLLGLGASLILASRKPPAKVALEPAEAPAAAG